MQETPSPAVGRPVEVRTRFDGRWSSGFRIAGVDEKGYLLERVSDGTLLRGRFATAELRFLEPGAVTPLPVVRRSTA